MPKRRLKAHYYHKKPFKINWVATIFILAIFTTLAVAYFSTLVTPPKSNLGTIEKMEDLLKIERVPIQTKKEK